MTGRDDRARVDAPGLSPVRLIVWLVVALASLVLLLLQWVIDPDPGLRNLQLSWGTDAAGDVLRAWAATDQLSDANASITIDFLFIPAYLFTVSAMCVWGRSVTTHFWRWLGTVAVVLLVLAAGLDVLENLGMRRMISTGDPGLAVPVSWCALLKLLFFFVALAYGVAAAGNRAALAAEGVIDRYGRRTLGPTSGLGNKQQILGSTQRQEDEGSKADLPRFPPTVALLRWLVGLSLRLPFAPHPPSPGPEPDPEKPTVAKTPTTGICCSGGGIRSASFNLGALQAFDEEGVLSSARYLSAVSGGSYIAASYAIVSSSSRPSPPVNPSRYAPGSPEEHFLRNHSAYLGPAGLSGKLWMILWTVVGAAVNLGFVFAALYIVATPLGWWYAEGLHPNLSLAADPEPSVRFWMWALTLSLAGAGLLLILGHLLVYPADRVHRLLRAWSIRFVVLGAVLWAVLIGLPLLIELVSEWSFGRIPRPELTIPLAGIGTLILGAVRGFVAKNKSLLARFAGAVVGPLLILGGFVMFARTAVRTGFATEHVVKWAIVLVLLAIFYAFADLSTWSPHPFYARALWSAFGIRRTSSVDGHPVAEGLPFDDNVPLTGVPAVSGVWPELIVCAAANISDEGATPPGRNATTFTFSPTEIGGPMGKIESGAFAEMLKERANTISLGVAVAVSGAALSPSMGKMTKRSIRFLMGLLNIRLGMWLPNPWWEKQGKWWSRLSEKGRVERFLRTRPRPRFLFREILGSNHANSKFLYVSDGGHYENLGLVELLRRGCTEIYCMDAAGDKQETFFTLGEAIELARTELQVSIDIRPDALRSDPKTGRPATDFTVGRFTYPNGVQGIFVYGKANVTEEAPWDVRAFREKDGRFPNHGTIDQFFNEQKFEAYRTLGYSTAARMSHWDDPELVQTRIAKGAEEPLLVLSDSAPRRRAGRRSKTSS